MALSDPAFVDDHIEYLGRSTHTSWTPAIEESARRTRDLVGDDVVSIVLGLHRHVGGAIT